MRGMTSSLELVEVNVQPNPQEEVGIPSTVKCTKEE